MEKLRLYIEKWIDGKKVKNINVTLYDIISSSAVTISNFLATHGLLHLLGYDHMTIEEEKEMFGMQEELLDAYGIKR